MSDIRLKHDGWVVVVDGSDASSPSTTCTSPGGNSVTVYHCFWMSFQKYVEDTITVTFPSAKAIDSVTIRPDIRDDSSNNYKIG